MTREHGSEFLVLLMPTKEEVYLPRVGEPVPPLAEAFRAALTKRGIDSIDLVGFPGAFPGCSEAAVL